MAITRLTGLASGMDTDSIIKDLMKAQRVPVNKLEQKKQIYEWQRDGYRDMNSLLLDLRNTIFNMKMQSPYQAKKAEVSLDNIVSVSASANANDGNYTIKINSLAQSAAITSGDIVRTGAGNSGFTLGSLSLAADTTLTIAGEKGSATIDVKTADTIDGFVSTVNAQSGKTGVKVSYDSTLDRLFFVSTTTGGNAKVDITSPDSNLLTGVLNLSQTTDMGQDADVVFNGVQGYYSTNNFSINGMTFTAKQANPTTTVDISVTQDTDTIFNTIKSFVDKYNEVIDKINNKIGEERYRNYDPLTKEQKEGLTEKEIELWDQKAKSGLLRGDNILTSALNAFRGTMYDTVTGLPSGDLDQLASIGITTKLYTEKGKLYIDEAKLRDALASKPDQVMRLFTASDGDITKTSSNDGLAVRLYDMIDDTIDQLKDKAGSSTSGLSGDVSLLGMDINRVSRQIDDWNAKLVNIENRYYKQFAAMESAINKLNSQSGWFQQQMGM